MDLARYVLLTHTDRTIRMRWLSRAVWGGNQVSHHPIQRPAQPGQPDQRQHGDFVMRALESLHHAGFFPSTSILWTLLIRRKSTSWAVDAQHEGHHWQDGAVYNSNSRSLVSARSLSQRCPHLHMELWQDICLFAAAVKASILWHLWYLTEPLTVLALFDGRLDSVI